MAAAPSRIVTVPVGVPEPLTVAVNVTDVPKVEGFNDETTEVVEATPFTVCVTAADVLGLKVASPW